VLESAAVHRSHALDRASLSIEGIRRDVNEGAITFGPHLVERMAQNGISIDQVLDAILKGTVRKRAPDERSAGRFTKYTISRGGITVTVKDCRPAFIITANRE
jgi:hypothetical protein